MNSKKNPKRVNTSFFDFEQLRAAPPSRQVARWVARRSRKLSVTIRVKEGVLGGTRQMRVM